jgi:hypothetical protein
VLANDRVDCTSALPATACIGDASLLDHLGCHSGTATITPGFS